MQGQILGQLGALRSTLGGTTDAHTALQFARSAPGVLTTLVGMHQLQHVTENLDLASLPCCSPEAFFKLFGPL